MEFILLKTLHIISILILFSCLLFEFFLIESQLTRQKIKSLSLIDRVYGISSLIILASGFYMALRIGKGSDFYFNNAAIYIKLALFFCVGLLSIYPTLFFLKNRKGDLSDLVVIPNTIQKIVLVEIILILSIPVFGVMLASGVNPQLLF